MDFELNFQSAQASCFENFTDTNPYEEISEDFQASDSTTVKANYLKSNCLQDYNMEEEEHHLSWPIKQRVARKIPRKFSRARPLTEEELDRKRVTANVQERRRMQRLNTALDKLKRAIPQHLHMQYRRLSKIKTLKLAIDYIGFLEQVLKPKFGVKCCGNTNHMQMCETKNTNVLDCKGSAITNTVLEDEGFLDNEVPNSRLVTPALPTALTCEDVVQNNQFSSYFVDVTMSQENEGFHYLEQF